MRLRLAISVVVLAACQPATPPPGEASLAAVRALAPCAPLPSPPASWPRRDLGGFSAQMPPNAVVEGGAGFDSKVGQFGTSSAGWSYDLGAYSDPLVRPGDGQASPPGCRVEVGGHPVRLVQFRLPDGRWYVGAAWRELPPAAGTDPLHLTLTGARPDSAWVLEGLAMVSSVRVARPP